MLEESVRLQREILATLKERPASLGSAGVNAELLRDCTAPSELGLRSPSRRGGCAPALSRGHAYATAVQSPCARSQASRDAGEYRSFTASEHRPDDAPASGSARCAYAVPEEANTKPCEGSSPPRPIPHDSLIGILLVHDTLTLAAMVPENLLASLISCRCQR